MNQIERLQKLPAASLPGFKSRFYLQRRTQTCNYNVDAFTVVIHTVINKEESDRRQYQDTIKLNKLFNHIKMIYTDQE